MEYREREAPPHNRHATRQACESWVKTRKCRPESSCFNGCNWVYCDETGSRPSQTAWACGNESTGVVLFEKGSDEPAADSSWGEVVTATNEGLRPRRRSAFVLGEASADDAPTQPEREQLARRRAERVRTALVERGVDAARIRAEVATPTARDDRQASIRLSPVGRVPEQLDPASDEYQCYCLEEPEKWQSPAGKSCPAGLPP